MKRVIVEFILRLSERTTKTYKIVLYFLVCVPWLMTAFSLVTLVMYASGETQKSLADCRVSTRHIRLQ